MRPRVLGCPRRIARLISSAMIDVLLVEDEPDHAELVHDTWEPGCGWRIVKHVSSLSDALAFLESESIDVVLLDLNLGASRGLDTLHRVRDTESPPVIVVLTSLDNKQLSRDAIRAGADDYIPKIQLSTELLERTLRHALERNRLVKELRSSNERLREFSSLAAHDLVAPLNRIAGIVDVLRAHGESGARELGSDALEMIGDECQRLVTLTRDLLALARTGPESLDIQSISLRECAEQAVVNLSVVIERSGARVQIDALPRAPADRGQITLLLQNLIENGIKYQPADQTPQVRVFCTRDAGFVKVRVHDNGIGIAPQNHRRIFESFHRLHGGEIPGNGLGLAHCARIVEHHGGAIGVDSTTGQGSSFWFTIPVRR